MPPFAATAECIFITLAVAGAFAGYSRYDDYRSRARAAEAELANEDELLRGGYERGYEEGRQSVLVEAFVADRWYAVLITRKGGRRTIGEPGCCCGALIIEAAEGLPLFASSARPVRGWQLAMLGRCPRMS